MSAALTNEQIMDRLQSNGIAFQWLPNGRAMTMGSIDATVLAGAVHAILAASSGALAAPDEYVGKWGYAEEGAENYNGMFDSEIDARSEAEAELAPGTVYAVGECTHPIEMIRGRAKHIGDDIVERVDEQTYDEVGGDDAAVDLNGEDRERLGLLVLDFIKREGSTNRWGVKNVKTHTVPDVSPDAPTGAQP